MNKDSKDTLRNLVSDEMLLLDTDMIIFKIASRNEYVLDFETNEKLGLYKYDEKNPNHIIHNTLDTAIQELEDYHEELEDRTGMFLVHCLSSKNNFRKNFYPVYKSNRTQRRPSILKDLREYVIKRFPYLEKDTYEADDLLGIYGTNYDFVTIASGDKDMKQIVTKQYDWKEHKFFNVEQEEATRFYYKQILIGDPVDGYKGLPSCGDVKSEKILDKAEEHYINYCNKIEDNTKVKRNLESFYMEHILNEYKKKEMSLKYLNIQMVMANILKVDYIDLELLKNTCERLNINIKDIYDE